MRLFSHQEEGECSAFPSLTDAINWYLNSSLLGNINITEKKDFTMRAIHLLWLYAIGKKKKKMMMNASKHYNVTLLKPPKMSLNDALGAHGHLLFVTGLV